MAILSADDTSYWSHSVINNNISGNTIYRVNNPDFTVRTTISDEIRKHEPRQFYLLLELLAAHIENFKGEFPGYPGLSYKAQVDNSNNSNELQYTITFTKEEHNNGS